MNARRLPLALPLILLLLAAAAQPLLVRIPGSEWGLSGLGVIGLLVAGISGRVPVRIWWGGAMILVLMGLYAWNPSHRWQEGVGLLPVDNWSTAPGSAFPFGTVRTLQLSVGLLAAFMLSFLLKRKEILALQIVVALLAMCLSVVVLGQRLKPAESPVFEYTGIFVNENHFAVLINLTLPLVLALASRSRFCQVQEGRPSSPAGVLLLSALLMMFALVISHSRAGILIMGLIVTVHVFLHIRWVKEYPFSNMPNSWLVRGLGGLIVTAMLVLVVMAFTREWSHWSGIQREWNFRFGMVKDTWAIWRDRPLWGTGPGSFSEVFPYYQSALFKGKEILHAHCEPVQFLSEYGLAGGAWILLAAVLFFSCPGKAVDQSFCLPPFSDLERRDFGLGLLAISLHALVDFPFRIPLLTMMAAVWAGVWLGTRPAHIAMKDWIKNSANTASDRAE